MRCGLLLSLPVLAAPAWPTIRPIDQKVEVDLTRSLVDFRLPILSGHGRPLYWLRCLGGSTARLDALGDHDGNNYVAPLACVLVVQADGWNASLLSEDDAAVWYSRGQYHGNDLFGECGRYPEFGTLRHFRLRGMKITLSAENIVVRQHNDVTRFTLHVRVEPDPSAHTANAERPGFLPPKNGDCHAVRKGNEPLMCRNEKTFSWQECSARQKHEMGYSGTNRQ